MKNTLAPIDVDELKQYLEDNNLTEEISKFKLESEIDELSQFGFSTSETYKLTITMQCTVKPTDE